MIFNNPSRFFPLLGRARRCYDWPRRTGENTDPGGTMAHQAAKKDWFITGAGRGMGVDFAKAALAARHTVVRITRKQRSGHIISISSTAGLVGFAFCSAYAAAKFGLEGWMESLQQEVAPFGITTTIVNPGFFRTELLEPASVTYAEPSIEDYADRTAEQLKWWQAQSGRQGGDPAKLARALVAIASEEPPPRRFIAGADAIALAEQHVADLQAQIDAYRELSTSLALDEPAPVGA